MGIARYLLLLLLWSPAFNSSFQILYTSPRSSVPQLHSTFASDASEYGSAESSDDADDELPNWNPTSEEDEEKQRFYSEEDDTPTEELSPVPLSKNAGNRFVAIVWDRLLHHNPDDVIEMHEDRIELTEEHVMFCRKKNLYNETFNYNSMVDILWSHQMYVSANQYPAAGV